MNKPLMIIGAFLFGWGLYTPIKKELTEKQKHDSVAHEEAKAVPIDEETNLDDSNSEPDSGDGV
jgi:hypothetical protein